MAWWMKIVAQEKMDNEKLFADPCDVQCVAVCWGTSQTVVKARELRGCHWKCHAGLLGASISVLGSVPARRER